MLLLIANMILGVASATHEPVRLGPFTGCNATAINVATQCEIRLQNNMIPIQYVTARDYHTLALYVFYDRGGGTGYTFHLDVCIEGHKSTDCTDSTDWYNVMAQTASTNYTDLEQKIYRRAVSVDDYAVFFVPLLYPRLRAHTILCTGGGCTANDKITITAEFHEESMGLFP